MVLLHKLLVLVLIIGVSASKTTATPTVHLEANRRNVPSGWANRNYLDEFLYGLIEGTTKISLAGKLDCPWEIYQLSRAWINMLKDWSTWSPEWSNEMTINIRK